MRVELEACSGGSCCRGHPSIGNPLHSQYLIRAGRHDTHRNATACADACARHQQDLMGSCQGICNLLQSSVIVDCDLPKTHRGEVFVSPNVFERRVLLEERTTISRRRRHECSSTNGKYKDGGWDLTATASCQSRVVNILCHARVAIVMLRPERVEFRGNCVTISGSS